MKPLDLAIALAGVAIAPVWSADRATVAPTTPNILFIIVDDLNDWVGALGGHPQAKTPNLDRLARQGTVFTNAHCQAPICHPSRISFMTGTLPSTTGMYSMGPMDFRRCPSLRDSAAVPTLAEYFAVRGYRTIGVGKVFHSSSATNTFQEYGPRGDWGLFPPDGTKFTKTPGRGAVGLGPLSGEGRRHRGSHHGQLGRGATARTGGEAILSRRRFLPAARADVCAGYVVGPAAGGAEGAVAATSG